MLSWLKRLFRPPLPIVGEEYTLNHPNPFERRRYMHLSVVVLEIVNGYVRYSCPAIPKSSPGHFASMHVRDFNLAFILKKDVTDPR